MSSLNHAEIWNPFVVVDQELAVAFKVPVRQTFEVSISGDAYQVETDGFVVRKGEHGDLKIGDGFAFTSIHVGLPQFGAPLLLNEDNLREDHRALWNLIEAAVEFEVLKFASKSNDWKAN